jgi:hypothetical protein
MRINPIINKKMKNGNCKFIINPYLKINIITILRKFIYFFKLKFQKKFNDSDDDDYDFDDSLDENNNKTYKIK